MKHQCGTQSQAKIELAKAIKDDYLLRLEERRKVEANWLLNINFMLGNQYSYVNSRSEIDNITRDFSWESREVFNHIAPIVESRLAKLGRVRPTVSVRPSGNEDSDIEIAKLSKSILTSVSNDMSLSSLIADASVWSEVTGTAFFKVYWNNDLGDSFEIPSVDEKSGNVLVDNNVKDGQSCKEYVDENQKENTINSKKVEKVTKQKLSAAVKKENSTKVLKSGDVVVEVISPFEIFPASDAVSSVEEQESIIHAHTIDASVAEELYDETFVGEDIDIFSVDSSSLNSYISGASNIDKPISSPMHNQVLVLEKYIKPNGEFPFGRLVVVVGDKVVADGELQCGVYPFVKQVSSEAICSFWGTSVVERCIPIQRAYNAIKNRKLEFLARLSSGVLAVEEGSVDIDNLEEEGLAPGKILVYRSGASLPKFMDAGSIPNDFREEEDRLLSEFITLTGVSELMRNSSVPGGVSSGTAINLLVEQDDTRLSVSGNYIRKSVLDISKKILALFKQFATIPKLAKVIDENGEVEIFYWTGKEISTDDVVIDTSNEISETPAMRKNMVLELLKNGLLVGDDGKISDRMRAKVLDALGFGNWEATQDVLALHIKKASKENLGFAELMVLEIDNHDVHIEEHTKYLLTDEGLKLNNKKRDALLQHIREHKKLKVVTSAL